MSVMTVPALKWESRFSTGDDAVDFDHQVLFALINELHCTVVDGCESTMAREMVVEFARYASGHFRTEESMMRSHGYPGTEAHMHAHRHLCGELVHLASATEPGHLDICLFAYDWLVQHIVGMDVPMIQYVRNASGLTLIRSSD
jgi:hemerythrin